MIALALASGGCAAFQPVVTTELAPSVESNVELRVVEGRPQSLVLSAIVPEAGDGDRLILRRASGDSVVELVAVTLESNLLSAARDQGLGLSDDTLETPGGYVYQVDWLRDGESLGTETIEVNWSDALPRPEKVSLLQLMEGVAEVSWEPGGAAAIFVRDVLSESGGLMRIDVPTTADGRHIVTGLAPDGVYAFRVALAREDGGYLRFGMPSEEVYLTLVPDEAADAD